MTQRIRFHLLQHALASEPSCETKPRHASHWDHEELNVIFHGNPGQASLPPFNFAGRSSRRRFGSQSGRTTASRGGLRRRSDLIDIVRDGPLTTALPFMLLHQFFSVGAWGRYGVSERPCVEKTSSHVRVARIFPRGRQHVGSKARWEGWHGRPNRSEEAPGPVQL